MRHLVSTVLSTCIALAVWPASSSALAREPVAGPIATLVRGALDARPVLYDEPGDGSTWALGVAWKARFDTSGATYFPRVGSAVQRSQPHQLSPDFVTIGGAPLVFDRAAAPSRNRDRIALNRGAFVESYDLAPRSLEQSFTFASSPGAGDLVLHVPVGVDGIVTDGGLELRSEGAHVSYSQAVVVDANGRRTPVETRLADGAITIRVTADVLAGCAWPIVVDPVVSGITGGATVGLDELACDSAYDASSGVWMVVWEVVHSAIDHDVLAMQVSSTGTPLGSSQVDIGPQSWFRPRVADQQISHQFLIVAGETTTTGIQRVSGRIAQPSGALGPQFVISVGASGANILPDVGGDSTPTSTSWCVVWEHDVPGSDKKVSFAMVDASHAVPFTTFTASGVDFTSPRISKSNDGNAWLIVWQAQGTIGLSDVAGTFVGPSGGLLSLPFTIASSSQNEGAPVPSSPISGTLRYAVTYVRGLSGFGGVRSVMAALLDGSTVLQSTPIRTLEGNVLVHDQLEPSVDSDGEHFLLAYSEISPAVPLATMYATDLAVVGDTLEAVQAHVLLHPGLSPDERRCSVAAARAGGTLDHRYLVTYDQGSTGDYDTTGRFFDGFAGGSVRQFCFSTPGACPCGNDGDGSGGCGNSVQANGAILDWSGTPSTLGDTLVLVAARLPPSTLCLFFQGSQTSTPSTFGDGLLCANGEIVRLATRVANASGAISFPSSGDPSVSARGGVPGGGGVRTYQLRYRNAAAFCTSATFNVTNGLIVDWAR